MSKFDQAKLKVAINEIIQASDGLDAIEPKDLRAECEDKLRLEKGTLDSATNKALCDSMVKEAMALKSKSNPTGLEDETKKRKKFSQQETTTIMTHIKEYVQQKNIALSELCANLRDEADKGHKHHAVWSELCTILPTRTRVAIRQHATRQIMREHGGSKAKGFTPEEVEQLVKLVDEKGQNWSIISRILGKLDDDCKHMYFRSIGRKIKGKFTDEEDDLLLLAIRDVMMLDASVPVEDMPEKGIRWKEVAVKMENNRQPLDYLRRWPFTKRAAIKKELEQGNVLVGKKGKGNDSAGAAGPTPKRIVAISREAAGDCPETWSFTLQWLECIESFNADNETEVIWAEIDKYMALPYSFSTKKWRAVKKEHKRTNDQGSSSTLPEVLTDLLRDFRTNQNMPMAAGNGTNDLGTSVTRRVAPPVIDGPRSRSLVPKPTGSGDDDPTTFSSSSSSSSSSSAAAANIMEAAVVVMSSGAGMMSSTIRGTAGAAIPASLPVDGENNNHMPPHPHEPLPLDVQPSMKKQKKKAKKAAAAAAAAALAAEGLDSTESQQNFHDDASGMDPKTLPLQVVDDGHVIKSQKRSKKRPLEDGAIVVAADGTTVAAAAAAAAPSKKKSKQSVVEKNASDAFIEGDDAISMLTQFVSEATTGAAGASNTSEHRFHKLMEHSAVNTAMAVVIASSGSGADANANAVGTSGSSAKPFKKRAHGDTMIGASATSSTTAVDQPEESDDTTEAAAAAAAEAALEKKRRKQEKKAAKNANV